MQLGNEYALGRRVHFGLLHHRQMFFRRLQQAQVSDQLQQEETSTVCQSKYLLRIELRQLELQQLFYSLQQFLVYMDIVYLWSRYDYFLGVSGVTNIHCRNMNLGKTILMSIFFFFLLKINKYQIYKPIHKNMDLYFSTRCLSLLLHMSSRQFYMKDVTTATIRYHNKDSLLWQLFVFKQ